MRHIYFVPGLAASSGIFDFIALPKDQFTTHILDWKLPLVGESLMAYGKRMAAAIVHDNPIIIGVSFGGIVAQELANLMPVDCIVIISSVKSTQEFPRRIRFSKTLQLHKMLPTFLIEHVEWLFKYNFGLGQKKLERYARYLTVRDKKYLDWAFDCIVNWDRVEPDTRVIHIHGELDAVFPIKYIKNCHVVPDATHAAVITHARWLNDNIPKLLNATT
jgi:pimeloyl-ACP methyl ester carboxylesterase